jgi:hypothetical protein
MVDEVFFDEFEYEEDFGMLVEAGKDPRRIIPKLIINKKIKETNMKQDDFNGFAHEGGGGGCIGDGGSAFIPGI